MAITTGGSGNPVIANTDRYHIDIGQTLYFNSRYLTANDLGLDGGLNVVALGPTSEAGVSVSWGPEGSARDGTTIYRALPGWEGVDVVNYTVTDADGSSAVGAIEITVGSGVSAPMETETGTETTPPPTTPATTSGTGDPVMAYDDQYRTDAGKALWFNTRYLTWNDKGADGGLDVVALDSTSQAGATVSWDETGTAIYRPLPGWQGIDTIGYTVRDADGSTDTAVVHIKVGDGTSTPSDGGETPPSSPPPTDTGNPVTALDDQYKIGSGKTLWFNTGYLTWNDKSADGGLKVVQLDGVSEHGVSVSWDENGTAVYRAPAGFDGIDHLNYTVQDADGSKDIGTLAIVVGSGDSAPPAPPPPSSDGSGNPVVAVDDAYKTDAGKALWFNSRYLTWNDKGADGGLKVVAVDNASDAGGTISWAADGTTIYRPKAGFSGVDHFSYTVADQDGSSDTAMIAVTVGSGVSEPPAPPPPTGGATMSFAGALEPVTADLSIDLATQVARIMPMGDSHTYGIVASYTDRESGGYRLYLSEKLQDSGIKFDFVGRAHSGPSTFDNAHEGYSGVQIDWLNARVPDMVNANHPDVVLLMAGNNDATVDSVATMKAQMSQLIDTLTTKAPDAEILIAGILPARPDNVVGMDLAKIAGFNELLPGLVSAKAAAGKHVTFVDTSSLTVNDISPLSVDKGVHLTHAAQEKLAGIWLDALKGLGIEQGTVAVHQDSLAGYQNLDGSAFNDVLKGDGGANTLRGNAGNDAIDGGAGNDLLWGGSGADRFAFVRGKAGHDTIGDFSSAAGDKVSTDYAPGEIHGWGTDTLVFQAAASPAEQLDAAGHAWSTADFLFS